jgi:SAM-dependent methyltransferase
MFEFHADKKHYFDIQEENARKYVIPFIEKKFPVQSGMRVMEIGCGEGGVLKAFINRGCTGVGIELDIPRIDNAAIWMKDDIESGKVRFVGKDIYLVEADELNGCFDIILLKDVIEHIHDQSRLLARLKDFLKPKGVVFFGFPPWQMPFGGHQQICSNKWLSRLPYYHLLPRPLYKAILKKYNEPVETFLEIRDTGISIERFERIVKKTNYLVVNKIHYFLNPIYEYKFGWKPRKQSVLIKHIPWVRNFFTTCVYYLITGKEEN